MKRNISNQEDALRSLQKRRGLRSISLTMSLLGILIVVSSSVLAEGATLRLVPQEIHIPIGQAGEISVAAENMTDLYGADLRLSFDPNMLQVIDADATTPGVQATPGQMPYPDYVAKNEANNATGTIWYAVTQLSPRQPAHGSGTMLTIRFRAKAAGTTRVQISFAQLADPNGLEIPCSAASESKVTIPTKPVEIPEPSALILTVSCLGVLVGYIKFKRRDSMR